MLLELIGWIGLIILGFMTLIWLVSLVLKDSSIVDIFWGSGFVIVNWSAFFLMPDAAPLRKWILSTLVTIWGLRLTIHIFSRNAGKGEDFRYKKWREENGKRWWWFSFFQVFLLQGVIMWIVSMPIIAFYAAPHSSLNLLDYLAIIIWVIGFLFEAGGDWQLARFRNNPDNKGKLLDTGFWRYTRHPNYFGDSAQWAAFYLIAAAGGQWWTFFSPIIMTFFLIKVSGVAMLERTLAEKKPGYKEYMEKTNAFFPWFPKK